MSKAVEIIIYKTALKPVAVFGSETWAVAEMEMIRGEKNIKKCASTGGTARNVENKN
jgi:hypothetical protein